MALSQQTRTEVILQRAVSDERAMLGGEDELVRFANMFKALTYAMVFWLYNRIMNPVAAEARGWAIATPSFEEFILQYVIHDDDEFDQWSGLFVRLYDSWKRAFDLFGTDPITIGQVMVPADGSPLQQIVCAVEVLCSAKGSYGPFPDLLIHWITVRLNIGDWLVASLKLDAIASKPLLGQLCSHTA